jgi:hypothetical protein
LERCIRILAIRIYNDKERDSVMGWPGGDIAKLNPYWWSSWLAAFCRAINERRVILGQATVNFVYNEDGDSKAYPAASEFHLILRGQKLRDLLFDLHEKIEGLLDDQPHGTNEVWFTQTGSLGSTWTGVVKPIPNVMMSSTWLKSELLNTYGFGAWPTSASQIENYDADVWQRIKQSMDLMKYVFVQCFVKSSGTPPAHWPTFYYRQQALSGDLEVDWDAVKVASQSTANGFWAGLPTGEPHHLGRSTAGTPGNMHLNEGADPTYDTAYSYGTRMESYIHCEKRSIAGGASSFVANFGSAEYTVNSSNSTPFGVAVGSVLSLGGDSSPQIRFRDANPADWPGECYVRMWFRDTDHTDDLGFGASHHINLSSSLTDQ